MDRYIIQGHLYQRMHFEVEPSELLTYQDASNMEIKSGSNEHPKTTILQMKILKLKKSVFNIQRGDLLCPFSAFFWQIRSILTVSG